MTAPEKKAARVGLSRSQLALMVKMRSVTANDFWLGRLRRPRYIESFQSCTTQRDSIRVYGTQRRGYGIDLAFSIATLTANWTTIMCVLIIN